VVLDGDGQVGTANAAPGPLTWRQDLTLSGYNTLALGINYEPLLRWRKDDAQALLQRTTWPIAATVSGAHRSAARAAAVRAGSNDPMQTRSSACARIPRPAAGTSPRRSRARRA
jgi:hypothetical protein